MISTLTTLMESINLLLGLQFLLDLTLKSAGLLLAAWVAAAALRGASAAARHWVWSLAVIGLLLTPVVSAALPGWRLGLLPSLAKPAAIEVAPVSEPANDLSQPIEPATTGAANQAAPQNSTSAAEQSSSAPAWLTWLISVPTLIQSVNTAGAWATAAILLWMTGLCWVTARWMAGSLRIRRLASRASRITEAAWMMLTRDQAKRLRLEANVELRQSDQVALPMTWGAWRSVVMLPAEADEWPLECRRIVLLHELAHVKRRDCLTQNLAQLACALYWFNPLVWLAARQLRVERELACDDEVLKAGARASDYAGHLVEIARSFHHGAETSPAAAGMACSQLESRVRSILDPEASRNGLNRSTAAVIGAGAACLILSLGAIKLWSQPAQASTLKTPAIIEQPAAPSGPTEQVESQAPKPANNPTAQNNQENRSISNEPAEKSAQNERNEENEPQQTNPAAAQSKELTVDQIIEMKIHGITPEYIESMRRAGFGDLPIRKLTQLKIHGVTPEYAEAWRKLGYDKLNADQLTGLKIHGIDEAYVKEMQNWLGGKPSINELMQIKIHGVNPEYARALKTLGYDNLPINKLMQMKIHGVNEQYIKEMRELGLEKLTTDDLVRMRIHGVTADYVKKMRAAGLKNVSVNQMIEMKIHGLDAILLKEKK